MICILKVIHYDWLMFLKTLGKCVQKFMNQTLQNVFQPRLAWQATLKKNEVKLELITDIDMLLMVEKGIRGGIYHFNNRYAKS